MSSRTSMMGLAVAAACAAVAGGGLWYRSSAGRVQPDERFQQALRALERGDVNAVAESATALEADPRYAGHVLLLDAGVLLKSGQPQQALALLTTLKLEGGLRAPGLLLLGECLYRAGRMSEAEVMLRRLVHERPDHVDAHRWLGAIYYDLGANTEAISELQRVIALDPGDYRPHRLIGLIYHDFEQHSQAIDHYRRALALNPPADVRGEILRELAKSLVAQRRYGEALEVIPSRTTDVELLGLRAECLWSLGHKDEARQCVAQAGSGHSGERSLALIESRILLDDGRPDDAVAVLQRRLDHTPHDAGCRYQLALAFRQLGNQDRYEAEMACWQESSELHTRLTQLNLKAIDQPQDPAVRDQLASLCEALERPELAQMWRRAAAACRAANATPNRGP